MQKPDFKTLKEFYPYYLTQHLHPTARALHFTGTGLLFPILGYMFYTQNWWLFFLLPVVGYGFAWTGHAFFEKKNLPHSETRCGAWLQTLSCSRMY